MVKYLIVNEGKEFADHHAVDQTHGIQNYFSYLYFSLQHRRNENFNGLLDSTSLR